jgi:PEP-CTERM motif
MRDKLMMMGIALVAVIGLGKPCSAGFITYNFVNYASLQNGATLSGSITTDGTIGALAASDITSWSVSVTGGSNPFSMNSTQIGAAVGTTGSGGLIATASQITLAIPVSGGQSQLDLTVGVGIITAQLQYFRSNIMPNPTGDAYLALTNTGSQTFSWDSTTNHNNSLVLTNNNPWTIAIAPGAAVPEPSSALLLGIAGVFGLGVAAYRKRK